MPQIQLIGGELDGWTTSVPSVNNRPDVYFAVPLQDEGQVKATKGAKCRAALRTKLATLAYSYIKTIRKDKVGWEYQYVRTPERDKASERQGEEAESE